ncbi:hypothetical protein HDV05_008122 [Chytridiales sp. JEL 0842]|nr:hypothetical protein HDV05_008122 [Chytridiales sp. JEL 0842]
MPKVDTHHDASDLYSGEYCGTVADIDYNPFPDELLSKRSRAEDIHSQHSEISTIAPDEIDDDQSCHQDETIDGGYSETGGKDVGFDDVSREEVQDACFGDGAEDFDRFSNGVESEVERDLETTPTQGYITTNTVTHPCPHCPKVFRKEGNLQNHLPKHDPFRVRPFKCTYEGCDRAFFKMGDLEKHMPVHNEEKSWVCEECGKGFKRKFVLMRHINGGCVDSSVTAAQEDVDGSKLKVGLDDDNYIPTQSSSAGTPPVFFCPYCSKKFARKYNLNNHLLSHDPFRDRPFVCDVEGCGKSFARGYDYKRHIQSHEPVKNWVCVECRSRYARKDALARHMKRGCLGVLSSEVVDAD